MSSTLAKLKSTNFLALTLFLQVAVYITEFYDVPVARQVVGFIYFTFFPGFLILKILKLNELDKVETVLLSVGLSVAFLMLAGLLINEVGQLFGITRPLSFLTLTVVLNGIILVIGVLAYLRNGGTKLWKTGIFEGHPMAILLLGLPVLSVVGVESVNAYNNNSILLSMIVVISLMFAMAVMFKRILPPKLYPIAVLVIALSLVYHAALVSNYLVTFGSDITGEYFVFQIVRNDAHWSLTNPYLGDISVGRTYDMLSVTILPTIYSSLLNLNPVWVFKALTPTIFSFVPLGLYKVWSRFTGSKYAFIAAFFFMSYQSFYSETLGLNKQMIGELFFVLLLLVVFSKKLKRFNKITLFLIFSLALVVSHYALAEIFLLFISFALIASFIMKRPIENITISMLFIFSVVMFSWYIYTSSSSVFDAFVYFGNNVYSQLGEFLNPAARSVEVLRGLGLEAPPTIWNTVSRAFAYLTELFIFIGFIGVITKRTEIHVEGEYFMFTLISMAFLAALILVPGLANTMNMTRFYHILLFFIAPLCVVGAEVIAKLVLKGRDELTRMRVVSILLLLVLVPYFLFQTGFVYEVTKTESWSVPLSKYRMNTLQLYTFGYLDAYDLSGAEWLAKNVAVRQKQIYSDYLSWNALRSQGVYLGYIETLSNTTNVISNGTVYLSRLNVIEGKVVGVRGRNSWNTTELSFLQSLNKVYSNGGSEVYKETP